MKYVSWLEAVVVEGLTPGKMEELAVKVESENPNGDMFGHSCRCGHCNNERKNGATAMQLRKWATTGLPRRTFDRIQEHTKLYAAHPDWKGYSLEEAVVRHAREAAATIEQLSKKHEGHRNSVVLRKHWPGRLCQVCGVKTEWGEMVVCGGRRRGEMSNRTGYAHLRCIRKLKIKPGEKMVKRELYIWGGHTWQGTYPNQVCVDHPPKLMKCGCRLSRQQCINTGATPTHVMWLGASGLCEAVAFDRKSLKVKEVKKHKVSKYKTKQQRLQERSAAE